MTHKEKQLAIKAINEVLEEHNVPYRLCAVCGKPLSDGYYYSPTEMCCSDRCGAKLEKVPLADFIKERQETPEEDIINYWDEGYYTTVPV